MQNQLSVFRFPFSVFRSPLILLRRLFFLAARQSVQAPSALAPHRQFSAFRFPLPPLSPPIHAI